MKTSKVLHIVSVMVGLLGVLSFIGILFGSSDGMVFGASKMDALVCTGILILIATWLQIATMHHIMLEKNNERI